MGSVEVNQSDMLGLRTALAGIKNAVPRVLTVSINKSIKTAQVQATRLIGQELNLTASRIKQDFIQVKANYSNLKGSLDHSSEPVGLVQFGARQTKKGVTLKVKRNSSRSLLKHAYIAFRGSKDHVYWRTYDGSRAKYNPQKKYGRMPGKYRSPVERLTGPRVGDIYDEPKIYNEVMDLAGEALIKNLDTETQSVLRQYG